jgi:hypothetical protein
MASRLVRTDAINLLAARGMRRQQVSVSIRSCQMTWINIDADLNDRRALFLLNTRLERGSDLRGHLDEAITALDHKQYLAAESALRSILCTFRPRLADAVLLGVRFDLATWNLKICVSHALLDPVSIGEKSPTLPMDPARELEFFNCPWLHGCDDDEAALDRLRTTLARIGTPPELRLSHEELIRLGQLAIERGSQVPRFVESLEEIDKSAAETASLQLRVTGASQVTIEKPRYVDGELATSDKESPRDWFNRVMSQPAE